MKFYELTYLLSPDLSQEELKEVRESITNLLLMKGGLLGISLSPVLKKLGCPLKMITDFNSRKRESKKEGYLASIDFHLEQGRLNELREKISKINGVMRFAIFSKKEKSESVKKKVPFGPPKILQEKPEKKVGLKEIEQKLEEILKE